MSAFAKSRTLIIFDVDGTLLDANAMDNACFDLAFQETTGRALTEYDWSQFKEVTARAIIHQALGPGWPDIASMENRVKDAFLAKLRSSHEQTPRALCPFPGAIELMASLMKRSDLSIAIATGCWRETAHFKLNAAGFDVSNVPFACASDRYSRAEIILLAAEKAGMPIEQAVYVGDGPWDFRATQELAIPFIGFGRKIKTLRQAGVTYTLDDWDLDALLKLLEQFPVRGS